jgi:hypothetical protein
MFRQVFHCTLVWLSLSSLAGSAQNWIRCGTDLLPRVEPAPLQAKMPPDWRTQSAAHKSADEPRYKIPMVFHVIHVDGPENISDAQILSQIDVLNEDFQRRPGTRGFGPGGRLSIEFFLAQKDPQGECTSGINRIWSPMTFHGLGDAFGSRQDQLAALAYWPPEQYLNVWLVHSIANNILAYANVGYSSGAAFDGIVIASKFVGRVGSVDAPYNLGRTLTHEVGHWLNLLHPFTDGCRGWSFPECTWQGDHVCDTPQYEGVFYSCARDPGLACADFYPRPTPIPTNNYMGYSEDSCMNAFTPGQIERMDSVLVFQRRRIWSDSNLVATGYGGCVTSRGSRVAASSPFGQPFPNPTSGTVKVPCRSRALVRAEVFDVIGRLVYSDTTKADERASLTFNFAMLPAGLYQLRVLDEFSGHARSYRLFIHQ